MTAMIYRSRMHLNHMFEDEIPFKLMLIRPDLQWVPQSRYQSSFLYESVSVGRIMKFVF